MSDDSTVDPTARTGRRRSVAAAAALATALCLPGATGLAHGADSQTAALEATSDRGGPATAGVTPPSVLNKAARTLARALDDPRWRARLAAASGRGRAVDLRQLAMSTDTRLAQRIAALNARLLESKGLPARAGELLVVRRLGGVAASSRSSTGAPLVAAATGDDGERRIRAFGAGGRRVTVDARRAPHRPVYLLDIDVERAHRAGLGVIADVLESEGLGVPRSPASLEPAEAGEAGWWTTRIDRIELRDDAEPWHKGDSEIFAVVTGFGDDGVAQAATVDMPYLDRDKSTYEPNQTLIFWAGYKYDQADVVMLEDDGDTNYHALAVAISEALLTVADQGQYVPLVRAVLDAIPADWWTDDPDFVDAWYTLATASSGELRGAAGNGTMTVSSQFVPAL